MWAGRKLSQKDAQKIEEPTGKPPDDLSDEEVEAAMEELAIEEQELTEEDKAALEAAENRPIAATLSPSAMSIMG
jgi:hypothetical protein